MNQTGISHHPLPPLLDADDERRLAARIEAGVLAWAALHDEVAWPEGASADELRALVALGREAWEHFLLANLRLVGQQAGAASRRSGVPADEFFQDGALGLAEALRRYDHTLGRRFSTYAFPWVRNAVLQAQVRRGGMLDGPVWRARQARMVRDLRQELEFSTGERVGDDELGRRLGRSAAWVRSVLAADQPRQSEAALVNLACPHAAAALAQVEHDEPWWLAELGTQEAQVLRLRYGLDDGVERTPARCAELLGVSQSTVRRLEHRALARARELLGEQLAQAA